MSASNSPVKKNNLLDKFYTKPEVAERLTEILEKNISLIDEDIFVEPSAGNGVWIECIDNYFEGDYDIYGYDLKPDKEWIQQQDFLEFNVKKTFDKQNIHWIGNPPFGRSSKLCRLFIKKMCEYENTKSISLILPVSYHKPYNQDTSFDKRFHLVYEEVLAKNSFTNEACNKKEFDCPAVFQIWEKRENFRISLRSQKTINKAHRYRAYNIKKKITAPIEADFAICFKGAAATKIFETSAKNKLGPIIQSPSYHFIELHSKFKEKISPENFIQIFKIIGYNKFEFYDVGSPSTNKQEVDNELTKCIFFVSLMNKYLKLNSILEKFDRIIEISKFIVNN